MKFSIVGAGALGTIAGAHLIEGGHAVRMIARGKRADYLRNNGLRVYGLREFATPCEVAERLGADDDGVVIYAVKTYHMEDALADVGHVRPRAVLSFANGVLKNEQLAKSFSRDCVVGCMANFSGELHPDGTVGFTRNICIHLGSNWLDCIDIVDAVHNSGLVTRHADSIESVEWSKFVGWVALFSLSILTKATTGVFMSNQRLARVVATIVREAAAVARARGIELIDQSPMPVKRIAGASIDEAVRAVVETGEEFLRTASNHRMSSLQDFEAGRELEVHETLGFIVREAERLGVDADTSRNCYRIIAGLNELPR